MWLMLTIINMILCGTVDIIEKKTSKYDPTRFTILGLTIYNLISLIICLISYKYAINKIEFINFLRILPFSVLTILGYFSSVKSFYYGNISEVSPIMKSKVILVLILNIIFLKGTLSIYQVLLIFIILILNILLSYKESNKDKSSLKGIIYAVLFLLFNGTATFLNKIYVDIFSNPLEISFYSSVVELLIIFLGLIIVKKLDYLNIKKFKNYGMIILMEIIEVIVVLLNRISLVTGNVTVISSIISCSIIVAIILSKIIFNEKISFKKWLIILSITFSVILLSIISS